MCLIQFQTDLFILDFPDSMDSTGTELPPPECGDGTYFV
jgi:hypothetical protein